MSTINYIGKFEEGKEYTLKIKSREELEKQLEAFIEEHKDNFSQEGICSEDNVRKGEAQRFDFLAGKEIKAKLVLHTDFDGKNDSYHYVAPWFEEDSKQYYINIEPDEVESLVA